MKRELILSFAAAIFVTACSKNTKLEQPLPDIDLDLPTLNTKAGNFATCDELLSWRNAKAAQWNHYNPPVQYGGGDTIPVPYGSSASAQPTNTQEHGVDEPDILKTDGQRIFLARAQSVEIINQDTLALEQSIDLPMLKELELYYDSGKLVVMGRPEFVMGASSMPLPPNAMPPAQYSVRIYARGGDGKFAVTSVHDFAGSRLGARLKDGALTLVTTDYLDWSAALAPADGKINGVPCAAFQKPLIDDFSQTLAYIHRFTLSAPGAVQSLARFGRADQMYMGENSLYLMASGYDWFWRDPRYAQSAPYEMLFVSKYALDEGPAFQAAGMIRGMAIGPYSFHENASEDLLYAITQSYRFQSGSALWTLEQLDSNLVLTTAPLGFSPGETLRAVRFVGDYAYAVTYRSYDPLSVFNLRDPHAPFFAGELDVPGFSAYLHPLANGKLLGIGFADATRSGRTTQTGLQISVFDVSRPETPAASVQQVYGDRMSYAAATHDPHAFLLDEAAGILALPATLFKRTYNPYGAGDLEFSGAMILNPSAPSASYGKITHWDWIPEDCRGMLYANRQVQFDVSRVIKVGNSLITVSPFGVRASDIANGYATTHDLQFADGEAECARMTNYPPVL